ncbi:hypothetical protein HK104_007801, partial [Borealophlyctis nickersoniae]
MEGNHRIGICLPSNTPFAGGEYVGYGTLLEISRCEPLPNSELLETSEGHLPRFLVETIGVRRFRVVERGMNPDGYHEALVERVDDVEPEDEGWEGVSNPDDVSAVDSSTSPHSSNTQPSQSSSKFLSLFSRKNSSSPSSSSPSKHTSHHLSHLFHLPQQHQDWNPPHLTSLITTARTFIHTLLASLPAHARHNFERQHGPMPRDPADLSFWIAGFLPLTP